MSVNDIENVNVRHATAEDLPTLRLLHHQLYPEYDATDEGTAENAWKAIVETPGRSVYIAELGALVVGTADVAVLANMAHRGERRYPARYPRPTSAGCHSKNRHTTQSSIIPALRERRCRS